MTPERLPDWAYPLAFFGVVLLIVAALWAVGNGRTAESYRSEVTAARQLLTEAHEPLSAEEETSITSALRSLDPRAIAEAESP